MKGELKPKKKEGSRRAGKESGLGLQRKRNLQRGFRVKKNAMADKGQTARVGKRSSVRLKGKFSEGLASIRR